MTLSFWKTSPLPLAPPIPIPALPTLGKTTYPTASLKYGFNLFIFILISFISRGLRFFIVAYLSYKFGDIFTKFMDEHGSKWFTILGILIVIICITIYLIFKSNA